MSQDAEERYDFYHKVEDKIPFDLSFFNKITKGGIPNKTLNIALAGTGVGKSLFMCHVAASPFFRARTSCISRWKWRRKRSLNALTRIFSTFLSKNLDLPKVMFDKKIKSLGKKTQGKLIIKEYPTASAHVDILSLLLVILLLSGHIRPDIIFIDYLNICASQRYKGIIVNSYTYVKAIAEELRGLACEATSLSYQCHADHSCRLW